jgi:hypothetical protein
VCALSIAPENMNAVIAASAALAGVGISLLGNWFLSWLKEGHERKVLLRSKYEELALLLVDSVGDYQKILTAESNQGLLKDSQPVSAQKAEALAHLYFPELRKSSNDYLTAIVAFRNACALAAAEKPQSPWIKALASSPNVEHAQSVLETAKTALEAQLQACARTYTQC